MTDAQHVFTGPSGIAVGRPRSTRGVARAARSVRQTGRRLAIGAALFAGDFIAGTLAIYAAQAVISEVMSLPPPALWPQPQVALLLLVFLAFGLYSGSAQCPYARFRMRGVGILLFVAFHCVTLGAAVGPARIALEAASYAAFLIVSCFYMELLVRRLLIGVGLWTAPTALVGLGARTLRLYETLVAQPELGFRPVGFLRTAADRDVSDAVLPAPVLGSIEDLGGPAADKVELAILTAGDQLALTNGISSRPPAVQLILLNDAPEMQTLGLRLRSLGDAVGLQLERDPMLGQNRVLKRAIDLAIAIPAAVLALPLMAVLALLISIVDRGSPFYLQPRIGRGGRPFNVLKLRTMYSDASRRLEEYLEANPEARKEWERYFKLSNDPRVLPIVGEFIRRTSLDELPQLWSVIIGEMSLVGPRPFPHYHLSCFPAEFQRIRSIVPPGLTGLWQVTARSNGDLDVQLAQDTFYIRNWSIWLDLYILFKTLPAILSGHGAR